jgi:hypothetical protein
LCGKPVGANTVVESIDGAEYTFDKEMCATTFKKLHSVYGNDFVVDLVR